MTIYFFILAISLIIVYLVTPNIRYIALKFYVIDKVNHRKIHKKVVTKLGGLAIYAGFLGGLFIILLFDINFFRTNFYPLAGLLICSFLMLLLGFYDDFQGSGALQKFIIQIIIAGLVIKSDFVLKGVSLPGLIDIKFGMFSIPLTIFWLVGITNSINLIDGLDGLAAGLSGIAASIIFLCGLITGDIFISYVSLALAGACFAFLRYNFYPAKIFMGDTGSLFLGLVIGMLALYRNNSEFSTNIYFLPVICVLLIPIIDTVLAIFRRLSRRQHIFKGDSSHLHHYFIKKGLSQSNTVVRFYLATCALGIVSLLILSILK